ncbi:MAG: betaine/proline/choline family ABC transporter ATP-binding protein [Spirochaetes bacterium]|jgi:osmoprotectant transport system ATP-binding protein|nr:betaine/proline/choline family ABC transporter ATP-binding protein [Spirochaetota bacterium]
MVEYHNVSKVFEDGTKAVDELSLTVGKGETVVFIGPSGCGKTTTLKMTNRLEECSGGHISIDGEDITTVDPVQLRRGIGYVIQETGLLPHLTVVENIATVPQLLGWPKRRIEARVAELLELAGLPPREFRYRLPSQLSGGQKQRIGVLRALAAEPDVVLMDEPFGALDPITRDRLQGELVELQEKLHKTIIFVTHDMDEALKLADRIVLMRRGKVEQIGSPDELQESPANDFVRDFIGEDRLSQITPDMSVEFLVEDAPLVVRPTTAAQEVLDGMEDLGRESAQVCDSRGRWMGMVFLPQAKATAGRGGSARDAMRADRKLRMSEASIQDAAQMLADQSIPIPVLDDENILLGVVSDEGVARMTITRLTRQKRRSRTEAAS